jgi:hypothetical protein
VFGSIHPSRVVQLSPRSTMRWSFTRYQQIHDSPDGATLASTFTRQNTIHLAKPLGSRLKDPHSTIPENNATERLQKQPLQPNSRRSYRKHPLSLLSSGQRTCTHDMETRLRGPTFYKKKETWQLEDYSDRRAETTRSFTSDLYTHTYTHTRRPTHADLSLEEQQ